jgi:ribosomal protein S18 acetylase RimI-like enzyme
MKKPLTSMTLKSFMERYSDELDAYYGEDFCLKEGVSLVKGSVDEGVTSLKTIIWVLVDSDEGTIPSDIKKKIRRAGKWRRDKLKHQWSYVNPLNRIHGYAILKDVTNTVTLSHHVPKKVLSISAICASYFTVGRGIGNALMKLTEDYAKEAGYTDIILEVANEYSAYAFIDEEEDDEEEDDTDDDTDSDEEEAEDYIPDDNVLEIISEEFWKKCMRKTVSQNPYYNLDQQYIKECLTEYFNSENKPFNSLVSVSDPISPGSEPIWSGSEPIWSGSEPIWSGSEPIWSGSEPNIVTDPDDPKDTEYGGFWYQKGKISQARLMKFYEKYGYIEDADVHLNWCCFTTVPYPTMRLEVN